MPRETVVSVRLDKDELAVVDARARDAGIERSTYLRCCATGARIVGIDRDLLRQALLGLKRAGNNLNQFVRFCHRCGAVPEGRDAADTLAACRAAIDAVAEFVAKEGGKR